VALAVVVGIGNNIFLIININNDDYFFGERKKEKGNGREMKEKKEMEMGGWEYGAVRYVNINIITFF
jgi:hypothetical protein